MSCSQVTVNSRATKGTRLYYYSVSRPPVSLSSRYLSLKSISLVETAKKKFWIRASLKIDIYFNSRKYT